MIKTVTPHWPAPSNVKAFCTTRLGGVSEGDFLGLNLGAHVNDSPISVADNRKKLEQHIQSLHDGAQTPTIQWLEQTHSTDIVPHTSGSHTLPADGCYSEKTGAVCAVMTADCLPVLLCNEAGSWVAAVHAGWRGLLDGIIESTLEQYKGGSSLMAWIGPAISQSCFEVGNDVYTEFVDSNDDYQQFFEHKHSDKWLCDLASIAEHKLQAHKVSVYQSDLCTYTNSEWFYSYRRDGQTGRQATVIWF